MRHQNSGRQLGRNTHHRRALFRNLVTSLLEHERIETTEAKAKEIRILADNMITLAKQGDLPARRRALAYVRTEAVVAKLFKELADRFSGRPGGYTRLIKTRRRVGDAAHMVVIELVAKPAESKEILRKDGGVSRGAGGKPVKGSPSIAPEKASSSAS